MVVYWVEGRFYNPPVTVTGGQTVGIWWSKCLRDVELWTCGSSGDIFVHGWAVPQGNSVLLVTTETFNILFRLAAGELDKLLPFFVLKSAISYCCMYGHTHTVWLVFYCRSNKKRPACNFNCSCSSFSHLNVCFLLQILTRDGCFWILFVWTDSLCVDV